MKYRSAALVLLVLFASFAIARAVASRAADPPAEPQTADAPQRFVVFEAIMRAT